MADPIEKNCKELHQLLNNLDKEGIVKKVISIKSTDRMEIRDKYKKINGKDIFDDIRKQLKNQLQDAIIGIFTDPFEYDAECIFSSMKDKESLLEIASTRPNWILEKIKTKFSEKFKEDLDDKIRNETLGEYRTLLLGLLKCNRKEKKILDKETCDEKAQDLADADYDEWKIKENSPFYQYLTLFSRRELILIAELYKKKSKKTLSQQIDNIFSGEIKNFVEATLYCLISPSEYLATRVKKALKGVSVDYRFLIRLFISRADIDLHLIKKYYHKLYLKEMSEDISTYIKDDYKIFFLEFLKKGN